MLIEKLTEEQKKSADIKYHLRLVDFGSNLLSDFGYEIIWVSNYFDKEEEALDYAKNLVINLNNEIALEIMISLFEGDKLVDTIYGRKLNESEVKTYKDYSQEIAKINDFIATVENIGNNLNALEKKASDINAHYKYITKGDLEASYAEIAKSSDNLKNTMLALSEELKQKEEKISRYKSQFLDIYSSLCNCFNIRDIYARYRKSVCFNEYDLSTIDFNYKDLTVTVYKLGNKYYLSNYIGMWDNNFEDYTEDNVVPYALQIVFRDK